jgi:hypothetical protein
MDFNYFSLHKSYTSFSIKDEIWSYNVFDSSFHLVDTIYNSRSVICDAHEFQILANGNYLIGGRRLDTADLSSNMIDGIQASAKTTIRGYVIEEFDSAHNLIFQWNSNDYINPLDGYAEYGYNPSDYNYCHGNAIEEDFDGNLLVSFRHLNAVYKINRENGEVIWILGGK